MDNNKKGALLVILAGVCWGSISIYINYLADAGLGTMQISFLRQVLSVLIFAAIILIRNPSKCRIEVRDIPLLMGVGLVNGVLFNFFY